jgi:hypothetical protein
VAVPVERAPAAVPESPAADVIIEIVEESEYDQGDEEGEDDGDEDQGSQTKVDVVLSKTPAVEELGIAWDKKAKKRVATEKNRKVSARAKVHGWLPGLE